MGQVERRRHVRAKPSPALPAHVIRQIAVGIAETLEIVDISVSGLAVATPSKLEVDGLVEMKLFIGTEPHAIQGRVRWCAKGMFGVELFDLSPDASKAIRRYVAELLERGG